MAYKGVVEDFRRIRENKIPRRVPCVSDSEEFVPRVFRAICGEVKQSSLN